jgi:hypothetical protein
MYRVACYLRSLEKPYVYVVKAKNGMDALSKFCASWINGETNLIHIVKVEIEYLDTSTVIG